MECRSLLKINVATHLFLPTIPNPNFNCRGTQAGLDLDEEFDYDTKPKHGSKAREIGRAEETEMMGRTVEDRWPIDLDVKRPSDHNDARPSVLYAPTGPLSRSVAGLFDLKQRLHGVALQRLDSKLYKRTATNTDGGVEEGDFHHGRCPWYGETAKDISP
ncbi:hypothetical protein THAOC_33666 [Thalassiosira oceanica]|uniref:Uncharacterized protein n=1 Tax=Thalassiosira oceanica TaxID=159749 RepID=K0RLL5_THAOC|nr:hypothetical protein THAOC_33666 [Thalassiosira oceanica]|eukprot:EJK47602.1 hypothetical protein THAOC_33666 [Thalassiosira oceanica]